MENLATERCVSTRSNKIEATNLWQFPPTYSRLSFETLSITLTFVVNRSDEKRRSGQKLRATERFRGSSNDMTHLRARERKIPRSPECFMRGVESRSSGRDFTRNCTVNRPVRTSRLFRFPYTGWIRLTRRPQITRKPFVAPKNRWKKSCATQRCSHIASVL